MKIKNKSEPEIFLQTRPTTCGVACMMMILHHFRGDKLTQSVEGKFRSDLKLKGYDIIPAISIASYLKKEGFSVFVYHQDSHLFWDHLLKMDPVMYDLQEKRYGYAYAAEIKVDTHTEVNTELLRSHLDKGALVICGIDLPGEIKHAVLLYGAGGDMISYIDPLSGKQIIPTSELLQMMKTTSGTWCIAVYPSDQKGGL
jgi:hypothetical protein